MAIMNNLKKDDILSALGLEQESWIAPAAAGFGIGLLLGAAAALLLAPKSGAEMRGDLLSKAQKARERIPGMAPTPETRPPL